MVKKVNPKKKAEVEDIKRLTSEYPVMGIVNLENLPAFQLLRIKHNLSDKVVLKVTKKRLIKIAFDEIKDKKDISNLKAKLIGIPALIFTKLDPFMLAKLLSKSKSKCAAKPGQTAPNDISIPAGPTDFPAGPMIGEFGQLGIKTKVEDGKISILSDTVLVSEGEVISDKIAELLSKLKIEPMEISLNLTMTYQNGEVLTKNVLFVDEQEYLNNIVLAYNNSIAIAMEIGYACVETTEKMIAKAELEAKALNEKVGKLKTEDVKEEKKEEVEKPVVEAKKMEEVQEQPVEETPEEEPVEETPEEPKEEQPQEETPEPVEEVQEEEKEKPEPVEETPEEIQEEEKVEEKEVKDIKEDEAKADRNLAPATDENVRVAQELLQKAVDGKIAKQDAEKGRVPTADELAKRAKKKEVKIEKKDVSKLVNDLKDKKARGEIK